MAEFEACWYCGHPQPKQLTLLEELFKIGIGPDSKGDRKEFYEIVRRVVYNVDREMQAYGCGYKPAGPDDSRLSDEIAKDKTKARSKKDPPPSLSPVNPPETEPHTLESRLLALGIGPESKDSCKALYDLVVSATEAVKQEEIVAGWNLFDSRDPDDHRTLTSRWQELEVR